MRYPVVFTTALLLYIAMPADAALGEKRVDLLPAKTKRFTNYSIVTSQDAAGTRIQEYVTPQGTVFAVLWCGRFKPNLQQLLGQRYFNIYMDNTRQSEPMASGAQHTEQSDLIVESFGQPNAFKGLAWLQSALPPGVVLKPLQC